MLTTSERSLTPAEVRTLSARLDQARRDSREALLKTGGASMLVCGVLALLTLGVSDAPVWVILLFWSALALLFTAWIGLPWHRTMRQQVASLDDAMRARRARTTRIQSSRVVEFEEEEDEGACYAFEDADLGLQAARAAGMVAVDIRPLRRATADLSDRPADAS